MAPFMEISPGQFMNESLDLMKYINQTYGQGTDLLGFERTDLLPQDEALSQFLDQLAVPLFNLVMPYWALGPEMSDADKIYFIKKKSAKRGNFSDLVLKREFFELEVYRQLEPPDLNNLLEKFQEKSNSTNRINYLDILLASHLWGLYLVPEFYLPAKIHHYLQSIKKITTFNYDEPSLWKNIETKNI